MVPPRSQLDVSTKAIFHQLLTSSDKEATWTTETSELRKGLLVARTLLPDKAEDLPVRVLNTTDAPVYLCKGTLVSELDPVTPLAGTQGRHGQQASEYRTCGIQETVPKKDTLTEEEIVDDIVSRVDEEVPDDV